MTEQEIVIKATEYIKHLFQDESSGHDFDHAIRVKEKALYIQRFEGGNKFIISLASLLHDVDDYKLFPNNKHNENASEFLNEMKITDEEQKAIINIINEISFKAKDSQIPSTLEGKIIQDADRLDAIGAIGIARTFAFGGAKGRKLYDFTERPQTDMNYEEYQKRSSSSLTHFYEKLLHLKDLMNTSTGKRMAIKRHHFLQVYLKEFLDELNLNEIE